MRIQSPSYIRNELPSGPVSSESNNTSRLLGDDLHQLGQWALRRGDLERAGHFFQDALPFHCGPRSGLEALQGQVNETYLEHLAHRFLDMLLDPASLGSMVLASGTFQISRGLFGVALGRMGFRTVTAATAFTLAFATEATAFPLYHRLLDQSLGHRVNWESAALQQDLGASFLTLGALRFFGAGASQIYRRMGAAPRWQGLFHQSGMGLGILSSRWAESTLGWQESGVDTAAWWLEAGAMWLHFNAAGRILGSVSGNHPQWNHRQSHPRHFFRQQGLALGQGSPLRSSTFRPFTPSEPGHRMVFSLGSGRGFFDLTQVEQYEAMARALSKHEGQIRGAARELGISERPFRDRLERARQNQVEVLRPWWESRSARGKQAQKLAMWREVVEALVDSQGELKGAAKQLGIAESTLHYRLAQARKHAPQDHPVTEWAERLSSQNRQRLRLNEMRRMARQLGKHEGNISAAARALGVSPTVIYNALRQVCENPHWKTPLRDWVGRLTESGKRQARRRRWMNYTLALIDSGGDLKGASGRLGITQGTYARFLEEITSTQGPDPIDPYYRRIILSTLSWVRPTDRRLLYLIRHGENETNRLAALQALTSEARVVKGTLRELLTVEESNLIRLAAKTSLHRERSDRVLWLLGVATRRLSFSQLVRGTGMLSRQMESVLRRYQELDWVRLNGAGVYYLSEAGNRVFRQQRHAFRWDLINLGLERTRGNRRQAAALLGVSHETFRKQIQAALGQNGDPGAVAPPGHLLHRWGDPLFQAQVRRHKIREARIEHYRDRWDRILEALGKFNGDFGQSAQALGLTEHRLAALIRLAEAYEYAPLRAFAAPELWRAHREKKLAQPWAELREQNRSWYRVHSEYQGRRLSELPLGEPIRQTPQKVRVELILRYQMGDRRAGDLLLRVYERWIRVFARRMQREGVSLDDLHQAGREALMEAALRFDPARGNRFSTYAQYYLLKNQINLLNSHLSSDVSRNDYVLYNRLQELRWEARGRGVELSQERLMELLGVSAERLQDIESIGHRAHARSLDQQRGNGEGWTLHDRVVGSRADGFQGRLAERFRRVLHQFFRDRPGPFEAVWDPQMLMVDREQVVDLALQSGITPKAYLKSRRRLLVALQEYLSERGIDSGYFE